MPAQPSEAEREQTHQLYGGDECAGVQKPASENPSARSNLSPHTHHPTVRLERLASSRVSHHSVNGLGCVLAPPPAIHTTRVYPSGAVLYATERTAPCLRPRPSLLGHETLIRRGRRRTSRTRSPGWMSAAATMSIITPPSKRKFCPMPCFGVCPSCFSRTCQKPSPTLLPSLPHVSWCCVRRPYACPYRTSGVLASLRCGRHVGG